MGRELEPEQAELLFRHYGAWFGPPAIRYRNTYIDGRTRAIVYARLRLPSQIPYQEVHYDSEAARLLILNEHYGRALEYVPEELRNLLDCATYCGLPREYIAPAFGTGRPPKLAAHTTPRRRQAIEGMARLLREAEQGLGYVTAERIREVLAPWL